MQDDPKDKLACLTNHLVSHIQLEHIIHDLPIPPLSRKVKPITGNKIATRPSVKPDSIKSTIVPSRVSPEILQALEKLRKIAIECTQCRLCKTRTRVVFGVGNPNAELVFVGEAPGRDEDIQGFPFVGRAGQLLTDMIEHPRSLNMKRSDVYICNVIKCRPPENRDPEPDEINSCEPYLLQQLDIIQPKVICALGKFAAQTLLRTDTRISQLRGEWREYHDIPMMPTYHPAALLRQASLKKDVWQDLLKIKEKLESLRS